MIGPGGPGVGWHILVESQTENLVWIEKSPSKYNLLSGHSRDCAALSECIPELPLLH